MLYIMYKIGEKYIKYFYLSVLYFKVQGVWNLDSFYIPPMVNNLLITQRTTVSAVPTFPNLFIADVGSI